MVSSGVGTAGAAIALLFCLMKLKNGQQRERELKTLQRSVRRGVKMLSGPDPTHAQILYLNSNAPYSSPEKICKSLKFVDCTIWQDSRLSFAPALVQTCTIVVPVTLLFPATTTFPNTTCCKAVHLHERAGGTTDCLCTIRNCNKITEHVSWKYSFCGICRKRRFIFSAHVLS